MRLDRATWYEIEERIAELPVILLPVGSTEQHGPMGVIGTDAICAETIAERAADQLRCLVAPTLAYTPAPFNMHFAGTVSVSVETFAWLFEEVVASLTSHNFKLVYVLNGHGANLQPMRQVQSKLEGNSLQIKSWWDFKPVNVLRRQYYGDWEGMHATPSEIAITQAIGRTIEPGIAADPPEQLSPEFISKHAGDKHGPPGEHKAQFPDGRVGSHSALARPEHGKALIDVAVSAIIDDVRDLMNLAE